MPEFEDRLTVLALHDRDAAEWKAEHPELADDARVFVANGRGWDALRGIIPTSISLGAAAAADANIGGCWPPRLTNLATLIAEGRRPHVLRAVA